MLLFPKMTFSSPKNHLHFSVLCHAIVCEPNNIPWTPVQTTWSACCAGPSGNVHYNEDDDDDDDDEENDEYDDDDNDDYGFMVSLLYQTFR